AVADHELTLDLQGGFVTGEEQPGTRVPPHGPGKETPSVVAETDQRKRVIDDGHRGNKVGPGLERSGDRSDRRPDRDVSTGRRLGGTRPSCPRRDSLPLAVDADQPGRLTV